MKKPHVSPISRHKSANGRRNANEITFAAGNRCNFLLRSIFGDSIKWNGRSSSVLMKTPAEGLVEASYLDLCDFVCALIEHYLNVCAYLHSKTSTAFVAFNFAPATLEPLSTHSNREFVLSKRFLSNSLHRIALIPLNFVSVLHGEPQSTESKKKLKKLYRARNGISR